MVKLSNCGTGLSGEGFAGCGASPLHFSVPADNRRERNRSSARLAGTILLAGGIRSKGFRAKLGRNILDLPVDHERRILDLWQEEIAGLSDYFGWRELRGKVLIDSGSSAPQFRGSPNASHHLAIERDGRAFRGTGGVLRDACRGIHADDYVVVCNAFQILHKPLSRLVERLLDVGGDLSFTKELCGGAGSVFLIRAGCLTAIPEVGFVDFKEQAISLIARSHRVRVVEASERSALPVRSLPEYITALRHHHGLAASSASPGFSIVEAGARVDQSSRVHDSVVLCGGRVEARAILAGSLVTANGMIGAGERVVGHLVTGRIGLASRR